MEKIYAVWLLKILGAGNKLSSLLCSYFGSFEEIYNAEEDELASIGMTDSHIKKMSDKNVDKAADVVKYCETFGIDIVTFYDVQYPSGLKNIPDSPLLLFVMGTLPENSERMVAVVGTRKPSVYGTRMAEIFSDGLASAGVVVVSGMARGVDTVAHKSALRAGGRTVAVLGCGVDIVYPPENAELKNLISKNGAVVSEFLPGTSPKPSCFPVRNRIVSGMTEATLVVEGKSSSGSTITAECALAQGKDIYCVPGNVDNPLSGAPNMMIRSGMARLVTCPEDIVCDMVGMNPEQITMFARSGDLGEESRLARIEALPSEQRVIAEALDSNTPKHIDQICFDSGLEISAINHTLFIMEMDGVVKQLPGKNYILAF